MDFSSIFLADIAEAFEFWKLQQLANPKVTVTEEQLDALPVETWIAGLLQQPIYGLLGQKRTNNAAKVTKETKKNTKGPTSRS